jgi:hypothetical protein
MMTQQIIHRMVSYDMLTCSWKIRQVVKEVVRTMPNIVTPCCFKLRSTAQDGFPTTFFFGSATMTANLPSPKIDSENMVAMTIMTLW